MVALAAPWRVYRHPDGSRTTELGGQRVQVLTRKEFLAEYWAYEHGEHVAVFGPTQAAGKTHLLFDLLGATDTQGLALPPVMMVAKPKSPTVERGIRRLGWKETDRWPPRQRNPFAAPPPGWAFWPHHRPEVETRVNDAQLAEKFRRVMHHTYWSGNTITVADEAYHFIALYGMSDDINRHVTQGQEMGSALWYATQRPSGTQQGALSGFLLNSATHTFISRDPVKTNRRKFGDISGAPSEIVEDATNRMPMYNFLYVHRNGPKLAVIQAA